MNFDRVAEKYDATRGFPPGVADRIATWVLSRLPKDPQVAEIGVGTGRIAVPFIERGVRYTGFDISQQMLDRLYAKLGGDLRRAQIHIADITQPLPVAERSQDAVIGVHILHLVDAEKALTQVRRILKEHGAFLWGYNMSDPMAPATCIRRNYNDTVAAITGAPKREWLPQAPRDLLTQWGARATRHTVAAWQETETARRELQPLRERAISSTWELSDQVLNEAIRRTEAWAKAEYGDLDRPLTNDCRFDVDWYQF